jgi:hypothetical protein
VSDRYKLCHEGGEPWVQRPNNGGEVGPDADEIVDELNELKSRLDALAAVEREWDPNTLAGLLGGTPGESQRAVIQREVPRLLARVNELEAFAKRFLCPEDLGFAVTACIRDDARIALGQPAVEFRTWNKPT